MSQNQESPERVAFIEVLIGSSSPSKRIFLGVSQIVRIEFDDENPGVGRVHLVGGANYNVESRQLHRLFQTNGALYTNAPS